MGFFGFFMFFFTFSGSKKGSGFAMGGDSGGATILHIAPLDHAESFAITIGLRTEKSEKSDREKVTLAGLKTRQYCRT